MASATINMVAGKAKITQSENPLQITKAGLVPIYLGTGFPPTSELLEIMRNNFV